ncbi:RNA polymerase II degradation factor 1 isoform X2 [Lucilia sericata]|uniref:RNA polymerase II degradation factor 1 isoform X2 n=1 Tax=Lucilia sericata TaxID=13632 RepID=UPI0018A7FC17|nr:RNA polymerase II degradation factor 1 isoform X2 [Lucilia sericata]
MEAKRSNTVQYQNNGHRVTTSSSKTQVMKNASEISLTPSQAAEQAKLNGRKHPLDALSKLPNKQVTVERRSGLQDVDEEYLKQNVFRKPLFSRNSGLNEVNASQNQMTNVPAAGQHSIPPSEGSVANPIISQAQLKVQQNYQEHLPANMTPSQIQMQSQVQSAAGTMPTVQNNQQTMNGKNQINHPAVSVQQDCQQQQQHHQQNAQQPQTTIYNNTLTNQEPEMCTTCPNCQTTIYLVRGADVSNDMTQKEYQTHNVPATPSG